MADSTLPLDAMQLERARETLFTCCGSRRWVEAMLARRPFVTRAALFEASERVWESLEPSDYLEAFSQHPEIGADLGQLRERFSSHASAALSQSEQSSVDAADEATVLALRDANRAYKQRFGHIFIVCATGKRANEMLAMLHERLQNDPVQELGIAAREQAKITTLRLEKLAI